MMDDKIMFKSFCRPLFCHKNLYQLKSYQKSRIQLKCNGKASHSAQSFLSSKTRVVGMFREPLAAM